jgi:hypothetical protein
MHAWRAKARAPAGTNQPRMICQKHTDEQRNMQPRFSPKVPQIGRPILQSTQSLSSVQVTRATRCTHQRLILPVNVLQYSLVLQNQVIAEQGALELFTSEA